MTHATGFTVEELPVEEVLPIRTRVLRPKWEPGRRAHYLEDRLPITCHYGIRAAGGQVVAAATFYLHDCPARPTIPAIKLRGMVVEPRWQGNGLGRKLLEQALPRLAARFPRHEIVWCIARSNAHAFYERMGFYTWAQAYELDGWGPHYIMWRELPRPGAEDVVYTAPQST